MRWICASLFALLLAALPARGLEFPSEGGQPLESKAWQEAVAQALLAAQKEVHRKPKRPAELEGITFPEDLERVIQKSIRELGDPVFEVQCRGVHKLEYLGEEAFDTCVKALNSENPIVRKWAAVILGPRGERAVEPLSQVVRNDPEDFVRSTAATSLGTTGSPDAVPALIEALNDADFFVRMSAISALVHFRDKRAVEPLIRLLDPGEDNQIRYRAAETLVKIDYEAAKKALLRVAAQEKDENMRRFLLLLAEAPPRTESANWPPELAPIVQLARDARTRAGERYGDAEIEQLLSHINSPYWAVRSQCLVALGHLGATSAVPAIIEALERYPGRERPYPTLAQIATREAVEHIILAVRSVDVHTKKPAVSGLGAGGRWAVPLLIQLLDDPDLRVIHPEEAPMPMPGIRWPDEHLAHMSLFRCLGRAGLHGESKNLATDGWLDEEIAGLKEWWSNYGEDILKGNAVQTPKITIVFYFT